MRDERESKICDHRFVTNRFLPISMGIRYSLRPPIWSPISCRFHERDAWAAVKGVWSSLFALRPWVSLAKAKIEGVGKDAHPKSSWIC